MTTHVFIVTEQSFKVHLEYMFAGTGSKDKDIDFNGGQHSLLHPKKENGLASMMADCSRVRENDNVIFYVQASRNSEGKYYGIFKVASQPFHEPYNQNQDQYPSPSLGKILIFRILIKPHEVYAEGVSEWKALDEINNLSAPSQMLWSMIYRKLKGNRGNTMITMYEANRICDLIAAENNNTPIRGNSYSFNGKAVTASQSPAKTYSGNTSVSFDILPRLLFKIKHNRAYESQLQMFIVQNIGRHSSLDNALGVIPGNLEWLGNEVSCGVGMQRIDIMFSQRTDDTHNEVVLIELKAVPASSDNTRQLTRYIDWVQQYYCPVNTTDSIRPVLICPASVLSTTTRSAFHKFNAYNAGRCRSLEYIELTDNGTDVIFTKQPY